MNKDKTKIKLIDLGISTEYVEQGKNNRFDMTAQAIGTCRYMAPEQFKGKLSLQTDVWSFGCVLLELCTGEKPYHDIKGNDWELFFKI